MQTTKEQRDEEGRGAADGRSREKRQSRWRQVERRKGECEREKEDGIPSVKSC
jgi:hypothetical protein